MSRNAVTWYRRFRLILAGVAVYCVGCSAPGEYSSIRPQAVGVRLPPAGLTVGRPTAPVTLVEFGSFSCGVCARFSAEVMPRLDSVYIRTGRLRYRYVDLSPAGPFLYNSAIAECSVPSLGLPVAKHWTFEHTLALPDVKTAVDSASARTGIALDSMTRCVTASVQSERRAAESRAATALGVTATPTFVVGQLDATGKLVGWPYVGLDRPDSLDRLIEAAERAIRSAAHE